MNGYRFGAQVESGPDSPFGMIFTDCDISGPATTVRVKGIFREEAHPGTRRPPAARSSSRSRPPTGESIIHQVDRFELLRHPLGRRQGAGDRPPRELRDPRQGAGLAPRLARRVARVPGRRVPARPSSRSGCRATGRATCAETTAAGWRGRLPLRRAHVRRRRAALTSPAARPASPRRASRASRPTTRRTAPARPTRPSRASSSRTPPQARRARRRHRAALARPRRASAGRRRQRRGHGHRPLAPGDSRLSTSAIVHPGEFYVALRTAGDLFVKAAMPSSPRSLAANPKGQRVAGAKVTVELVPPQVVGRPPGGRRRLPQLEPRSRTRSSPPAPWRPRRTPASCSLAALRRRLLRGPRHRQDRRQNPIAASVGLYATGDAGETSWARLRPHGGRARRRPQELRGRPDRAGAGEVALQVGRGLGHRRARRRLHQAARARSRARCPPIDVPITEELRPNAFVSVLLVRGRSKARARRKDAADIGAPSFRLGYAALPINPEKRRLDLAIKPSKTELRPGRSDRRRRRRQGLHRQAGPRRGHALRRRRGRALSASATAPPIPSRFSAPRASSRCTPSRLARSWPASATPSANLGLDKGLDGGGGGATARRAPRLPPERLLEPVARHRRQGPRAPSFKLPDSLTTYRVMAVAAAEDDRFGYAEQRVVTQPAAHGAPRVPALRPRRRHARRRRGRHLQGPAQDQRRGGHRRRRPHPRRRPREPRRPSSSTATARPRSASRSARPAPARPSSASESRAAAPRTRSRSPATSDPPRCMEAVALYGDTTKASAEKLGDLQRCATTPAGST